MWSALEMTVDLQFSGKILDVYLKWMFTLFNSDWRYESRSKNKGVQYIDKFLNLLRILT